MTISLLEIQTSSQINDIQIHPLYNLESLVLHKAIIAFSLTDLTIAFQIENLTVFKGRQGLKNFLLEF